MDKLCKYISLLISLLLFFSIYSCFDGETEDVIDTTIEIALEVVYPTQVWLRVTMSDSGEIRDFKIERDGDETIIGSLMGADTLIVDNNVQGDQTYSYIAYVVHDGRTYNSSSPVVISLDESTASQFKYLGLEGKWVTRLRVYYPYLYACAARDGLWRINLDVLSTDWEYWGLADTTTEDVRGITDVVQEMNNPSTVLAAFYSENLEDLRTIHKTTDGGMNWSLADSGLFYETGTGDWVPDRVNIFFDYQPVEGTVFTFSSALYSSEDFGETWQFEESFGGAQGGGSVWYYNVKHHPQYTNNIWAGGMSARGGGQATLSKSADNGETWDKIDLGDIAFFAVSIDKIAFDAENPNIVYINADPVRKTEDGGTTWSEPLTTLPEGAEPYTILADPELSGHLFIGTQNTVAESWDGGETWTEVEVPYVGYIRDMIYHDATETLFISTTDGVYQYFPQ